MESKQLRVTNDWLNRKFIINFTNKVQIFFKLDCFLQDMRLLNCRMFGRRTNFIGKRLLRASVKKEQFNM